jgi:flagella basal body P-ring formation protein FlgA
LILERPAGVCFVQPTEHLSRERMETALREAAPDWRVELLDWPRDPAGRTGFPAGELRFDRRAIPRPSRPATVPRVTVRPVTVPPVTVPPVTVPPVTWRGLLVARDGRQYPVWAKVRVTCERPGLILARAIAAQEPITEADVTQTNLEEHPLWPPPLHTPDQLQGQRARRTLKAGAVLLGQDLAPAPTVRRGDRLNVAASAGSTVLHIQAMAEASAHTGQILLLKNPASGRRFQARVTGPGQAIAVTTNP